MAAYPQNLPGIRRPGPQHSNSAPAADSIPLSPSPTPSPSSSLPGKGFNEATCKACNASFTASSPETTEWLLESHLRRRHDKRVRVEVQVEEQQSNAVAPPPNPPAAAPPSNPPAAARPSNPPAASSPSNPPAAAPDAEPQTIHGTWLPWPQTPITVNPGTQTNHAAIRELTYTLLAIKDATDVSFEEIREFTQWKERYILDIFSGAAIPPWLDIFQLAAVFSLVPQHLEEEFSKAHGRSQRASLPGNRSREQPQPPATSEEARP